MTRHQLRLSIATTRKTETCCSDTFLDVAQRVVINVIGETYLTTCTSANIVMHGDVEITNVVTFEGTPQIQIRKKRWLKRLRKKKAETKCQAG